MLGLGCLKPNGFSPSQIKNAPVEDARVKSALLRDGDLLLSRSNTRELVALPGIFHSIGVACSYPDLMMRLEANDLTSNEFLELAIRGVLVRRQLVRAAVGTSGSMVKINATTVVSATLALPPKRHQEAIVEITRRIDTACLRAEATISKLELLHDAASARLLFRGDGDEPAVPRADRYLDASDLPPAWKIAPIGQFVSSMTDGPFGSNLKTEHYVSLPEVRVVRLQNIGRNRFDDKDKVYVSREHARLLNRHRVIRGDLLVAALGDENHPVARACTFPFDSEAIVKADCFRVRLWKGKLIEPYVMLVLNSGWTRQVINRLGQGVTRDRINLSLLRGIQIRVPPIEEQHRIVAILDAHDARIRAEQAELDKLRALKKGLLDDLLTGRVRVPVSADAPAASMPAE